MDNGRMMLHLEIRVDLGIVFECTLQSVQSICSPEILVRWRSKDRDKLKCMHHAVEMESFSK